MGNWIAREERVTPPAATDDQVAVATVATAAATNAQVAAAITRPWDLVGMTCDAKAARIVSSNSLVLDIVHGTEIIGCYVYLDYQGPESHYVSGTYHDYDPAADTGDAAIDSARNEFRRLVGKDNLRVTFLRPTSLAFMIVKLVNADGVDVAERMVATGHGFPPREWGVGMALDNLTTH